MDKEVLNLVNQKDDLQLVIRCHLVIEHYLVKFIELKLVNPEEFNSERLNFRQKVELAIALGSIDKSKKGILLALNKLRNKYAHDMRHKVTDNEIKQLESALYSSGRIGLSNTSYYDKSTVEKLGGIFLLIYTHLSMDFENA